VLDDLKVSLLRQRPGVESVREHGDGERDEEDEHHGQRPRGGFERATDHDAPTAARQMMQHDDGERTDRNARPENVADEVSAPEPLKIDERAERAQNERDETDDERASSEPLDGGRGVVSCGYSVRRVHGVRSPPAP
jgi:hypothetical protein